MALKCLRSRQRLLGQSCQRGNRGTRWGWREERLFVEHLCGAACTMKYNILLKVYSRGKISVFGFKMRLAVALWARDSQGLNRSIETSQIICWFLTKIYNNNSQIGYVLLLGKFRKNIPSLLPVFSCPLTSVKSQNRTIKNLEIIYEYDRISSLGIYGNKPGFFFFPLLNPLVVA